MIIVSCMIIITGIIGFLISDYYCNNTHTKRLEGLKQIISTQIHTLQTHITILSDKIFKLECKMRKIEKKDEVKIKRKYIKKDK